MQAAADQVQWIPVEAILPCESNLDEMPNGAVHVCAENDGHYRLLSGGETLRRMREAGQVCADAVVRPREELNRRISRLLDALVKGDLHYLDEAQEYRSLLQESRWTAQQLAERVGRTPATLSRKMRLLELGEEACAMLRENRLCERYAQLLLRVPGQAGRMRILRHIIREGLSVKEAEQLINDVLSRMPVPVAGGRRMKPVMRDYRLYVNAIRGIVEQMGDAGLDSRMQVTVGRHVAEVRITIPVFSNRAK